MISWPETVFRGFDKNHPWSNFAKAMTLIFSSFFPNIFIHIYIYLVGGFNPSEKNISQNGNLPQIWVNIKNIWNHHLDTYVLQNHMHILGTAYPCHPWDWCIYYHACLIFMVYTCGYIYIPSTIHHGCYGLDFKLAIHRFPVPKPPGHVAICNLHAPCRCAIIQQEMKPTPLLPRFLVIQPPL